MSKARYNYYQHKETKILLRQSYNMADCYIEELESEKAELIEFVESLIYEDIPIHIRNDMAELLNKFKED